MKKGWTEDESTDVRTRDLARRQRNIYNGAKPWGAYPPHIGKPFVPTQKVDYSGHDHSLIHDDWWWEDGCSIPLNYFANQAHPRRTDWHRVAQGTVVLVALAAASAALIVSVALLIRSVWT